MEMTERLQIGDLPSARDQGERAGDFSCVDVVLEMLADARQARRGETDVFRLGDHGVLLVFDIAGTASGPDAFMARRPPAAGSTAARRGSRVGRSRRSRPSRRPARETWKV